MFVGAGPGDPDLITVKGQQALMKADVVIYAGSLVPEAVLKWTRPETRRISSAALNLEQIVDEMGRASEAGERVVRLHSGDPSLYGAIFEQMAELQKRNISYQVIPGVTAAFAAAAAMGLDQNIMAALVCINSKRFYSTTIKLSVDTFCRFCLAEVFFDFD